MKRFIFIFKSDFFVKTIFIVVFGLSLGISSFAQYSSIPLPGTSTDAVVAEDISDLIGEVAYFLIISSTIIAVIFIVWGGIQWMSSGDNTEKQKKAKANIQNGIIGALIVLAVGVILQTIASFVDTFSINP